MDRKSDGQVDVFLRIAAKMVVGGFHPDMWFLISAAVIIVLTFFGV